LPSSLIVMTGFVSIKEAEGAFIDAHPYNSANNALAANILNSFTFFSS
jgi:hypothetical protein